VGAIVIAAVLAAILLAVIARLQTGTRLRGLARRAWDRAHRRQWTEIQQLRRDVDGLLKVVDRLAQPGTGDWAAQWAYAQKILGELGKNGISSLPQDEEQGQTWVWPG
jgi:hypothetical protein